MLSWSAGAVQTGSMGAQISRAMLPPAEKVEDASYDMRKNRCSKHQTRAAHVVDK